MLYRVHLAWAGHPFVHLYKTEYLCYQRYIYICTVVPSYKATPSQMKKCPYKRGGPSWGGQIY
jgi:hypothetical protein